MGAQALRGRLREMQDAAREEILWFCRANPLAMEGPENTEEDSALARGVRYRAIYERELLEKPGELASIVESISAGEEARTLPALPVRLAIADRELAICPLVPDEARELGEPTAALIRSSELLDALVALFESYWERATPLLADAPRAELPAPEALLLSLFVSGLPDKSIATHLGVSKRTVQRRLDRLMALAGVDTRTGLAFQAARRGWLAAPADPAGQPRVGADDRLVERVAGPVRGPHPQRHRRAPARDPGRRRAPSPPASWRRRLWTPRRAACGAGPEAQPERCPPVVPGAPRSPRAAAAASRRRRAERPRGLGTGALESSPRRRARW